MKKNPMKIAGRKKTAVSGGGKLLDIRSLGV
jgi:hypothetical protein